MTRLIDFFALTLLRRIAIGPRLIGAFVLIALLPLAIGGAISYTAQTRASAERARQFSTEMVKQVSKNLRMAMAKMETESESLVLSDRVQDALARYGSGVDTDKAAARTELTRVLLERYGSFDFINQKYFLDTANRIVDNQVFATLGRGVVTFVEHAPNLHGRPYWASYGGSGAQSSIVLMRAIYSKSSTRLAGTLFLGVRPSQFTALLDDVDLGKGSDVFVLDIGTGQRIVNGSMLADGALPAADAALQEHIRRAMLDNRFNGFTRYRNAQGVDVLAAYAQVPETAWFVASTLPASTLTADAQAARSQLTIAGVALFAVSLLIAALIAHSIAAPLSTLLAAMADAEGGQYGRRVAPDGDDELSTLAGRFNALAAKVDRNQVRLEERVDERTRDLEEANAKLESLSMTDGLTGIANRRRFDAALAEELARTSRTGAPLALLMCDVDYFKAYNDRYGHPEGDAVLRRIARLLQAQARRPGDLAARYGGEEFVLVATDSNAAAALKLAESVRASVAAMQLAHEPSPLGCITISIGVAVCTGGDRADAPTLVRAADDAMYRAKGQGRNQVVVTG